MIVARHSGRDAGIQSQGCETVDYRAYKIKHLCNRQITVHGSGLRHPGRNDGVLAKMKIADTALCRVANLCFLCIVCRTGRMNKINYSVFMLKSNLMLSLHAFFY